jgi:hypothetical protein
MELQFQHRASVVLTDIVFDRDLNQTTEIKRIESTARTFKTKETGRRIRA